MNIPTPPRLSRTGAVAALCALFTVLAILLLSYLFCVGVAEAASLDGRMPGWLRPWAEACSRPARFAASLPVVQIPAQLGIDFGYGFAGGSDTTR